MSKNKQIFYNWIRIKISLTKITKLPPIKEGEVWWCGMGQNVGVEINGKNQGFSRPVIVYKKLSRYGFLAIPLSTQPHQGNWYVSFHFQNRAQVAVLAQIRIISTLRLYNRMGVLSHGDFRKICHQFTLLYCKQKNTPSPRWIGQRVMSRIYFYYTTKSLKNINEFFAFRRHNDICLILL